MKDYYKILGIDKTASKDEIKKAFRKLAHEHHPDKTKGDKAAEQRFKEASEAYSVLSDDQKRKQYDTFGSAGPGGAGFGGTGGFNPNDFAGFDFSQFTQGFGQNGQVEFDLGDLFGEFFGGGRGRGTTRQQRGRDISIDVSLSFEESVFGTEKDIIVTKTSQCLTCSGSGAAPGTGMETCTTCNGKGKINEVRRSFIGVFNTARVCDVCHGKGQVPREKCPTCRGDGVVDRQQEISVKIPSGIEDGEMIRLNGMGEAVPNGMPGDMYVRVHVKPHPYIRKQGHDLLMDIKVKLTQAIAGGDQTLKLLEHDGELALKIPEGTNNLDMLRVKGKGVPDGRNRRGDLLVKVHIEMPRKLSKTARQAIDELRKEGF